MLWLRHVSIRPIPAAAAHVLRSNITSTTPQTSAAAAAKQLGGPVVQAASPKGQKGPLANKGTFAVGVALALALLVMVVSIVINVGLVVAVATLAKRLAVANVRGPSANTELTRTSVTINGGAAPSAVPDVLLAAGN